MRSGTRRGESFPWSLSLVVRVPAPPRRRRCHRRRSCHRGCQVGCPPAGLFLGVSFSRPSWRRATTLSAPPARVAPELVQGVATLFVGGNIWRQPRHQRQRLRQPEKQEVVHVPPTAVVTVAVVVALPPPPSSIWQRGVWWRTVLRRRQRRRRRRFLRQERCRLLSSRLPPRATATTARGGTLAPADAAPARPARRRRSPSILVHRVSLLLGPPVQACSRALFLLPLVAPAPRAGGGGWEESGGIGNGHGSGSRSGSGSSRSAAGICAVSGGKGSSSRGWEWAPCASGGAGGRQLSLGLAEKMQLRKEKEAEGEGDVWRSGGTVVANNGGERFPMFSYPHPPRFVEKIGFFKLIFFHDDGGADQRNKNKRFPPHSWDLLEHLIDNHQKTDCCIRLGKKTFLGLFVGRLHSTRGINCLPPCAEAPRHFFRDFSDIVLEAVMKKHYG